MLVYEHIMNTLSTEAAILDLWSQICSRVSWSQIKYKPWKTRLPPALVMFPIDLFGSYRKVHGHLNRRVLCMLGVSERQLSAYQRRGTGKAETKTTSLQRYIK